ncbi:hypothetical protein [Enterobacter kobei]|nr:hypothetical protein [Enterobacter kobei]
MRANPAQMPDTDIIPRYVWPGHSDDACSLHRQDVFWLSDVSPVS